MDDLLQEPIRWDRAWFTKKHIVGRATHRGQKLAVRVNNFPDEPMFTLISAHGQLDFDDWPSAWGTKPYQVPYGSGSGRCSYLKGPHMRRSSPRHPRA